MLQHFRQLRPLWRSQAQRITILLCPDQNKFIRVHLHASWASLVEAPFLPTGYEQFKQIIPQHVTAEPDQVLTQTAQTEYNKYVQCICNFYVFGKSF